MIYFKNNAIIFFDGYCNLCNASVNFIIKRDAESYFKFSSLTSEFSKDFLIENNYNILDFKTIILFENNQLYSKSDAVLRILKNLKTPLKYCYYLKYIPKSIRDLIYDLIAKNRYSWFGKRDECLIPSKEIFNRFL